MAKKEINKPPPPKRALSAFFLFRQEVYDKVRAQNPSAKITQITKIISEMWNKAQESVKDRLEKQYQKHKEIATKAKADYIAKYGQIEKTKKRKNKKE